MKRARIWMKRTLLVLAILVLLYALLGFVGIPLVVRKIAVPRLGDAIGRDVKLAGMSFNPFLLRTRLAGFEILEPDGTRFAGFDEAAADLEFTKLLRGIIWIREFRLQAPSARVKRSAEGRMNFQDIVERLATGEAETTEGGGGLPRFFVETAGIADGNIEWRDEAVDPPFEADLSPIAFEVAGFGTLGGSENRLGFDAVGKRGFTIDWEGDFDPSSLEGVGTLRVAGVLVSSFQPYVADYVRFRIEETQVDLELPCEIRPRDAMDPFAVQDARLEFRDLRLTTLDEQSERFFEIGSFVIAGANVAVGAHTVSAAGIAVNNGSVLVRHAPDGEVNLFSLFRLGTVDETATGGPAASAEEVPAPAQRDAGPAWTFEADRFGVTNFVIRAQDAKPVRPVDVELAIETLALKPVSSQLDREVAVEGSCRIGEGGKLGVTGSLRLEPKDIEIAFKAVSVPLSGFGGYLAEVLDVVLEQGSLDAGGTVTVRGAQTLEIGFAGDVAIGEAVVREADRDGEIFNLERLALNGLAVDTAASSVRADHIEVVAPVLELVVDTNGILNVTTLARADDGEGAQTTEQEAAGPTDSAGPDSPESPAAAPAAPLWRVTVPELRLETGTLRLTNNRFDPPARTVLSGVATTVRGFSTAGDEATDLQITGRIDPFAEFTIAGSFYPTAFDRDTSLRVSTSGVDLAPLSGYAGQFIGYGLDGGSLDLDLEYDIKAKALHGENRITIQGLRLGDASAHPAAPDMPVGLAVSMLQDRQGRIVLDVPVSGSLDDPSFDIGSVITKAVTSPITKVASAPFAVVGSVFGGREDQDLSFLFFEPGTDRPAPGERDKLDVLARALIDRPLLSLELAGYADISVDREPLARMKLQEGLRALQAANPGLPQGSLENAEVYTALVSEAYARGLPSSTDNAAAMSPPDVTGGGEASPTPGPAPDTSRSEPEGLRETETPAPEAPVPRGELRAGPLLGARATGPVVRALQQPAQPRTAQPAPAPDAAAERGEPSPSAMEASLLTEIEIGEEDLAALGKARAQAVVGFFQSAHDLGAPRVTALAVESASSSGPVVRFSLK